MKKAERVLTKRKCRQCSKFLPASRYFNCHTCQPELPSVNEDFIFEDVNDWRIDDDLYDAFESEESFDAFTKKAGEYKKQEDHILGRDAWKKLK